jgi:hypothetical protein
MMKKPKPVMSPMQRRERNLRRLTQAAIIGGIVAPSPITAGMMGVVAAKGVGLHMDQAAAKRAAMQKRIVSRLKEPTPRVVPPFSTGPNRQPVRTVTLKKAEALRAMRQRKVR